MRLRALHGKNEAKSRWCPPPPSTEHFCRYILAYTGAIVSLTYEKVNLIKNPKPRYPKN